MTFTSVRVSGSITRTRAVDRRASRAPSAKLAPTTGIVGVAGTTVPTIRRLAVGRVPLVEDDERTGACGLGIGRLESEAASATLNQGNAAGGKAGEVVGPPGSGTIGAPTAASVKAPSQPLVVARGGTRLMSIGMTFPVTSPAPLFVKAPVS